MILNNNNNNIFTETNYKINYCIDSNLENVLQQTKEKIDNCYYWDYNKKLYYIYEFIYTSSNKKFNISNITPISRSFFKLIEILYEFKLILKQNSYCCIAEGPGGFLQCLKYYLKNKDLNFNKLFGISLLSNDKSIPHWNPVILKDNDIQILEGEDKTGDLYKLININNFIENIGENKIELVTCDGGIDYSNDYNNQEILSYKLIYSEIYLTLNIQKNNGCCIIKFFDLLYIKTIQLLYILYLTYDEIIIYKPCMSRTTNSEKYIICKGYRKNIEIINKLLKYWDNPEDLSIHISKDFIDNIKEYNNKIINSQIININKIINSKNKKKKIIPTTYQLNQAYQWCDKYNIPINKHHIYLKHEFT